MEDTSRQFSRRLQEVSESARSKFLFSFMETVLEICGPVGLGQCIAIICGGEPFLTDIVGCTAEQDIVEFLVTFALCCQLTQGRFIQIKI